MKKLTCIAIDDEPIALSVISTFCNRHKGIELKTYSNPQTGLEEILKTSPDIVFLDIEMNGITGLEIARKMPETSCFIFTTAYSHYALTGYELDAVDFLHKPFSYERFQTAIDKAVRRLSSIKEPEEENLIVKQEYNNVIIPLSDILYIEAMENYSKIYRLTERYVLVRKNLKSITELLPPKKFIRIHRSYIISVDKISSFSRQEIILQTNKALPIGRQYAEQALNILK